MASCAIDFYVNRESDGSLQRSILFDDLRKLTGNDRKLSKEYYFLGKDKEFLEKYGKEAKFDENGEITVNSLIKLAHLDIHEDRMISMLNDEIGSGVQTYDNVISRLQNFNRNHHLNDEFMATIIPTQDGKYDFQIVKRNAANEEALYDVIRKQSLQNRILYSLRQKGVDVEFIENDSRERGRYSTENAEQTAEGYWSLIRVLKGDRVTPTLAQEAGHFAVGALGKDPLVMRLSEALTPEVMQSIVAEDDITVLGQNPRREIMGRLVGEAILEDTTSRNPLRKLAKRIWNKAKQVFFTLVDDNVQLMVLNARATAEQIAKGFMSPDFTGTVENALDYEETLFDADLPDQVIAFRDIANSLKLMAANMQNIFGSDNPSAYKDFYKLANAAEVGFDYDNGFHAERQALARIAQVIQNLEQQIVHSIPTLLNNVDINDIRFMQHVPAYAKNLRAVHTFCSTIGYIENVIDTLASDKSISLQAANTPEDGSIADMIHDLSQKVKDNILTKCIDKEYNLFLKYLTEFYGKDYVMRAGRMVFNFNSDPHQAKEPLLKYIGSQKVKLSQALSKLDHDISFLDRWMTSMANNPDIIGQLADKISKYANKSADDATNYVWDELRKMELALRSGKLGTSNTRIFCETDHEGNITGNYLSKVEFWRWEEDYDEFIRKSRIAFYVSVFETAYAANQLADRDEYERRLADAQNDTQKMYLKRDFGKRMVSSWPALERAERWDEYMHTKRKEFHEKYSDHVPVTDPISNEPLTDEDGNPLMMYIPKEYEKDKDGNIIREMYHNSKWDEIMGDPTYGAERIKFLNQLRALKLGCDQYLPINANRIYRMPMFRGTFIERMKNRMKTGEQGGATFMGAMLSNTRENIINTFTVNSDDTEYGTLQTYNTVKDSTDNLFEDALAAQLDKIERVPFFGINKLRDRNIKRRNEIRKYERELENGNFEHEELLKSLKRQSVNEISTDLLQSMLAYASMAHTYGATSSIVDVLEVGRNVLERRDDMSVPFRKRKHKGSYALQRYSTFMEKQVYQIGVSAPKWDKYGITRKIGQGLSSLASKVFLGGNIAGGIVNTGTGAIELFKESVAGQFWSVEEFAKAYKIYQKCGLDSIIHAGAEFKQDDVSLIIRHFNIRGDIREAHRHWDTSNKDAMRISNLIQGSIWAPYKTGDHFMQSMSYIIALLHNKVVDKNGNRISLLDMYKQNIVTETVDGKTMRRIRWKPGGGFEDTVREDNSTEENIYYKDVTDAETGMHARQASRIINSILRRVNEQLELGDPSVMSSLRLDAEELDFLSSHGLLYTIPDEHGNSTGVMDTHRYAELSQRLQDLDQQFIWSTRNESDLMDMCREINDRLHGIYNRQDKVAFQGNLIGSMLLAMRGYALGMAARRFSSDRYNAATGDNFEGSMVTFGKAVLSLFSAEFKKIDDATGRRMTDQEFQEANQRRIRNTLLAIVFPYFSKNKEAMMKLGWSEAQYSNLRRNNMDFLIIAALMLLRALSTADTGSAGEDDDLKRKIKELQEQKKQGLYVQEDAIKALKQRREELKKQKKDAMNNIPMGLIHYFAARWLREQAAFNTPGGMNQEGNALLEWRPAGWSVIEEMVKTAYLGVGALLSDQYNSKFYYQRDDSAGERYKKYDTKFGQQVLRYIPYYRSFQSVFKRPYHALKSYEYNFDR